MFDEYLQEKLLSKKSNDDNVGESDSGGGGDSSEGLEIKCSDIDNNSNNKNDVGECLIRDDSGSAGSVEI